MRAIAQVLAFDVISKVFLGVLSIVYIRFMTPDEFARLTFAIAVAMLIGQILASSFNRIYILGYSHLGLESRFLSFLGSQALMVVVAAVCLLPLAGMQLDTSIAAALFALSLTMFESGKTVYQQRRHFLGYSLLELLRAVLVGCGAGLLIWNLGDTLKAWQVLGIQALGMAVVFVGVLLFRRRSAEPVSGGQSADLLAQVLHGPYRYLFGYFLVLSVFTQLDVLMLWYFGNEFQLAVYGSAFRYYGLLSLVMGAVHVVLLPAIQQARFRSDLTDVFRMHGRVILLFFPVFVVSAWGAVLLLPWVDKGRYPDAVAVFQVLCVSAFVSLTFSPHVNWLMRVRRFRFLFILILVASVLNFTMNYLLIPIYGAIGVAFATAVAASLVTVPIFYLSRQLIRAVPETCAVENFVRSVKVRKL